MAESPPRIDLIQHDKWQFWRCLMTHAAVMLTVLVVFVTIGRLVFGYDVWHLATHVFVASLAIGMHICAERMVRRFERRMGQLVHQQIPRTPSRLQQ